MECPLCDGQITTRIKGPKTGIVFLQCPSCGYSRCAKKHLVLRLVLDDYAEVIGVDPATLTDDPTNPEELAVCLKSLLQSQELSRLPSKTQRPPT